MDDNEKKIKYWTVGTSAISYLDNVKRWILNKNLISTMREQNDFAIILRKFEGENENFVVEFSCEENSQNEKTTVYKAKKSYYSFAALDQFLRVLCYFGILIPPLNQKDKYVLTQEFINKFIYNKELNGKNVDKEIAIFLLSNVSEKFKEYYANLIENLKNYEEMHLLLWKEGNDDYKITRSLLYHADEIKKFLDLDEIKKIYNKKSNITDDNQTRENFSFKKVFSTKIFNYVDKEELNKNEKISLLKKAIRNIIHIIRVFYKLPSELSNKVLEETKNVVEEYKKYLSIEKYEEDHFQRPENIPKCECKTIYHLINDFKNYKINIPIFQRDYVWNSELINNLIDSLYDDFISNKYSYLNNIIICTSNEKEKWKIIDGQQRIFTLLLILFSLFKITTHNEFYLEHEILELLFSQDRNEYKDIYTNLQDTNIYGNFSKIIDPPKENQESKEEQELKIIKRIIRNIIDNLANKLTNTQDEKEQNSNISNFINHILWNTYVSLTTLPNSMPEKIFENINKNGKALDSLDLLRNYIYSMCINNKWKISKNHTIENYIEKYNEIINHFFDDKDKINYNKLEHFTLTLHKREVKQSNNEFFKSNKSVYTFNLLREIFDIWGKENNKVDSILDCFLNSIYKYEYIVNCSKSPSANYPKVEIPALSSQIYGASLGGNTVFVSIIWKLLDEFKAFNWPNGNITKNEELAELSKWLFEIERFNIFWKITAFKGQSISLALDSIVKDFFDGNSEWKTKRLDFKNKLLEIIPELESLSDEDKNKALSTRLESFKTNPLAFSDRLKFLLLNRINFALNNIGKNKIISNNSLYIKANGYSINNECKDWHNILQYEHCLAKKDELSKNMPKEKLEVFVKNINLFGNGSILDPSKNKEIKNKDLTEKVKKYESIGKNNFTIHGKCGFLQGFNKLNINNSINKLDDIYELIKTRTDELIELVKKIYNY